MATVCCACVVWSVPEKMVAIVTRLGSFKKILDSGGPYCINPFFEVVYSTVNLKQQQIPIRLDAKSVDDTILTIDIKVQFRIKGSKEGIYDSQFKLANPRGQIQSYVEDVVRTSVAAQTMQQVFESKTEIADAITETLGENMGKFGYEILATPVTDVFPTRSVRDAMDNKNISLLNKEAAVFETNKQKMQVVMAAEAERTAKELAGEGISLQRQAIVKGLSDSVEAFANEIGDVTPKDVLELVLITQYFDMMKDIGTQRGGKVVYTDGTGGIRDQMIGALEVKR